MSESDLLESYNYEFNSNLIATRPIFPKSKAKLLVYNRKTDSIIHSTFAEFLDFIPSDYLVVLNDTKVINARMFGNKKSGAKCEILYHNFIDENKCLAQIRGKVNIGDEIIISQSLRAKILEKLENGLRVIEFYSGDKVIKKDALLKMLEVVGTIPLPPYIKREASAEDKTDYQSVFAKFPGAIAAPTASLHFDENDLNKIKSRAHCFITLHVGAGTFFSVETKNISEFKIHKEEFFINHSAKTALDSAKNILCVGTTSCRCVEFYFKTKQTSGMCDIFINPLNPPKKTNALLTNFHLPKTTLIMLVAGFIGIEKTKQIYKIAQEKSYRFYSYGDGMLIL